MVTLDSDVVTLDSDVVTLYNDVVNLYNEIMNLDTSLTHPYHPRKGIYVVYVVLVF